MKWQDWTHYNIIIKWGFILHIEKEKLFPKNLIIKIIIDNEIN